MVNWQPLGSADIFSGVSVVSPCSNPTQLDLLPEVLTFRSLEWNLEWMGKWICSTEPAAVSWGPNRLDVFLIIQNVSCTHGAYNGTAWVWNDLGGQWATPPSALSWGVNRIDVFIQGDSDQIYYQYYDGASWSGWNALSGTTFASPPAAVSWDPNRLDVFALGVPEHKDYGTTGNLSLCKRRGMQLKKKGGGKSGCFYDWDR